MRVAFLSDKNHSHILIRQLTAHYPDVQAYFVTPLTAYRLLTCDIVHIIFPVLSPFAVRVIAILKKLNKKILRHWIGSDVMAMSHNPAKKKLMVEAGSYTDANITQSTELQHELQALGVQSKIVRIITDDVTYHEVPMPQTFTVLCYLPKGKENFYGYETLVQLAKDFPDISFLVSSHDGDGLTHLPNITYLGRVDSADDLLNRASCLLRIVEHDGLSKMIIEALGKGRQVIWIYKFPFCHTATNYTETANALRTIATNGNTLNAGASDYVRSELSVKKNISLLKHTYDSLLSTQPQ